MKNRATRKIVAGSISIQNIQRQASKPHQSSFIDEPAALAIR